MAGGERGHDEVRSRVRNRGRSRVRDQCHIAGRQSFEEELAATALVVIVVADSRGVDLEMRKQAAAMPSVFRRNQIDLTEDTNRPK